MIKLKGITWDHPRGYNPLIKTTEEFRKINPNIEIEWSKRTLKEFGDFPISKLIESYDLLIIDHPFTGEAQKRKYYVNLSRYLTKDELDIIKNEELGQCYRCYNYKGEQLAVPVDAAALVSASREDLFKKNNLKKPSKIEEIFDLADRIPKDLKIAVPLCSIDIWCLFLSLCANIYGTEFINEKTGIINEIGKKAIEYIKRLRKVSSENSLDLNPIQILDMMANENSIIYSPFLFGYVNYSIPNKYKYIVEFCNSPLINNDKPYPLLGGAGIAISTRSSHKKEAAEYVKYVTLPDVQKGMYVTAGGQPSHKCAWVSEENNRNASNFFGNTIETMEKAYVRPRIPSWNEFQEEASVYLNEAVREDINNNKIINGINKIHSKFFR